MCWLVLSLLFDQQLKYQLTALNGIATFLPHYERIRHKHHGNGDFNDPGQDQDHLYQVEDCVIECSVQRERRPDSDRRRL